MGLLFLSEQVGCKEGALEERCGLLYLLRLMVECGVFAAAIPQLLS
jgi:hypothetical protein